MVKKKIRNNIDQFPAFSSNIVHLHSHSPERPVNPGGQQGDEIGRSGRLSGPKTGELSLSVIFAASSLFSRPNVRTP